MVYLLIKVAIGIDKVHSWIYPLNMTNASAIKMTDNYHHKSLMMSQHTLL